MLSSVYIMDVPKEIEGVSDALLAWRIYTAYWDPAALHTDGINAQVNNAAQELSENISRSSDSGECIYVSILALKAFLCQQPSALDFGLDVFRTAAARLPQSVEHNYGKGRKGAETMLKFFFVDLSTFFQDMIPPAKLGKTDTVEGSNIVFQREEIVDAREDVLKKIQDWQYAKLEIIVLLAMLGRCHSKNYARLSRGEHIGDHATILINNVLQRHSEGTPKWSKSDFVGCCILLRACASSLIATLPADSRDVTVANWKKGFTAFLYSDGGGSNEDDNFAVKVNAAVSDRIEHLNEV
jgi:hypothetical protein